MWSQRINASSESSLFRDIHNSLTVSNIWKVSIEKPGSLELISVQKDLSDKSVQV